MANGYPKWQYAVGAYFFLSAGGAMILGSISTYYMGNGPVLLVAGLVVGAILTVIGARYAVRAFGHTIERAPPDASL